MPRLFGDLIQRALDANGAPVSGAKLSTFAAGTTTPVTTFSDLALTTAHASPVVADSSGVFPTIYVPTGSYKVTMTTPDNAALPGSPQDNIVVTASIGNAFDSRTDAVAATIPATLTYITTAGYYAAGDGGGGLYKRVNAAPSGHNLYFASADGAVWELIPEGGMVDVRQAGAKGDGVADDQPAFQAAGDWAHPRGGTVGIPTGAYLFATAGVYHEGISGQRVGFVHYKGLQPRAVSQIQIANNQGARILMGSETAIGFHFVDCNSMVLENLTIVSAPGTTRTGGHAIKIEGERGAIIQDVSIFEQIDSVFLTGTSDFSIDKLIIDDVSGGVYGMRIEGNPQISNARVHDVQIFAVAGEPLASTDGLVLGEGTASVFFYKLQVQRFRDDVVVNDTGPSTNIATLLRFTDCAVESASRYGYHFLKAQKVKMTNGNVTLCHSDGIRIAADSTNHFIIDGTEIGTNNGHGIYNSSDCLLFVTNSHINQTSAGNAGPGGVGANAVRTRDGINCDGATTRLIAQGNRIGGDTTGGSGGNSMRDAIRIEAAVTDPELIIKGNNMLNLGTGTSAFVGFRFLGTRNAKISVDGNLGTGVTGVRFEGGVRFENVTAVPPSGTVVVLGDMFLNVSGTVGQPKGWVATTAGTLGSGGAVTSVGNL